MTRFWYKPDTGTVALLITLGCPESDLDEVYQRVARQLPFGTSGEMLSATRKAMSDVARERKALTTKDSRE